MKVGSLVVCLESISGSAEVKPVIKDLIYTVKEMMMGFRRADNMPALGLAFEEIENGPHPSGGEVLYDAQFFREIQPPMNIDLLEILGKTGEFTDARFLPLTSCKLRMPYSYDWSFKTSLTEEQLKKMFGRWREDPNCP